MKIIKRHKGLAIVCLLTLILLIVLGAIFSKMLFSTKKGEYGDRLDGITEISESELKEIKSKISENETVSSVTVRTQGKIIYTNIIFTEKETLKHAKEIASKTLEYYDEDMLKDYDFEFLLTQDMPSVENEDGELETKKGFAAAGNKHPDHDYISWTRS